MKAVFDTKAGSPYDDDAAIRYHFPNAKYLPLAEQCVGDWVVYREPRDAGGSLAYFAVARVAEIIADPAAQSHSYALMADYLQFDTPVPFRSGGRYEEGALRDLPRPSDVGVSLRGRSIRALTQEDFASIVLKGLTETLAPENSIRLDLNHHSTDAEARSILYSAPEEKARRIEQILLNRRIRDANFRRSVLAAYNDTCAVTGLRIRDRGNMVETQAAHIVPVAAGGSDIVQNGIALCATAHWLFDRHLITVGEDLRLRVAHEHLPRQVLLLLKSLRGRLLLPENTRVGPAAKFLDHHRQRFAAHSPISASPRGPAT